MALITSPVPEIGAANGTEQADATNLLQEIKNLLNGGLALDNLSTLLQQVTNPPVVTALPGSPVTGQRVRLRMGPGVLAPLRYNADAEGTFKWEADGASVPLRSSTAAGGMTAPTAASLTVPAAGIYDVCAHVETNQGNTNGEIGLTVTSNPTEIGRARSFTSGVRLDFGPTRLQLTAGAQNLNVLAQAGGSMYTSGFSIQPVQVG